MIEVVSTRKNSACVWLSVEQLIVLSEACYRAGWNAVINGERIKGDAMLDMRTEIDAVRREVYDEEDDC